MALVLVFLSKSKRKKEKRKKEEKRSLYLEHLPSYAFLLNDAYQCHPRINRDYISLWRLLQPTGVDQEPWGRITSISSTASQFLDRLSRTFFRSICFEAI